MVLRLLTKGLTRLNNEVKELKEGQESLKKGQEILQNDFALIKYKWLFRT